MKKISSDKMKSLRASGRVVAKKPPPPAKPKPPVVQDNKVATAAAASMVESAKLMKLIGEKLQQMEDRPARSYRLTVIRNERGMTEYVDAVPIGK